MKMSTGETPLNLCYGSKALILKREWDADLQAGAFQLRVQGAESEKQFGSPRQALGSS